MADEQTHQRINDILLGPLERPALRWLAAHMPAWATPDTLTVVGIVGSFMIFFGFALSGLARNWLWVAILGFVVNWFGDSLDGTVARYRKIERPKYGYFVDHIVDAFSQVLVFTGLGLSPYVRFDVAVLALVGYMLMSVLIYVRTNVVGVFQISYAKLGPTEMRVLAILVSLAFYAFPAPRFNLAGLSLSLYDLVIAAIAALLFLFFLGSAISQARELAQLDP